MTKRLEEPLKKKRSAKRRPLEAVARSPLTVTDNQWPEPVSPGEPLPRVCSFEENLLPEVLRVPAVDAAIRSGAPFDFAVACVTNVYSGAVQRRGRIHPKGLLDKYQERFNVWGAMVGAPGVLKSPLLYLLAGGLYEIEKELAKKHGEALRRHRREVELAGARTRIRRAEIAIILEQRPDITADELADVLRDGEEVPAAPRPKRLVLDDFTYQRAHELLIANPAGLFCINDELASLILEADQPGHVREKSFYLRAWSGNMPYRLDTIRRGELAVPELCLSIFGAITPDDLRFYIMDAARRGRLNTGLLSRFSLLAWPDVGPDFEYRSMPSVRFAKLEQLYERVLKIDPERPLIYSFTAAGQDLYREWLISLERRLRSGCITPPVLESHVGKYRKLMPVLSGLWAMADGQEDLVGPCYVEQAIRICEILETHANRVYSCVNSSPRMQLARELAKKIRDREIGACVSAPA